MASYILTLNGGSSSVKFSLFDFSAPSPCIIRGQIERLGLPGTFLAYQQYDNSLEKFDLEGDREKVINVLFTKLSEWTQGNTIDHIGHRVVHGMGKHDHEKITPDLLSWLRSIAPIDPEHLPNEIELIEMAIERFPHASHVACFDTVFHRDIPRVASILPFPKEMEILGVRRYGFHGLSLSSILRTLKEKYPGEEHKKIIALHLGSGVSVTAISEGKSIDTSMSFSPAAGVPMSTRPGDVDPGALLFAMKRRGLSIDDAIHMVNHTSGLFGMAGSADMEVLLSQEEERTEAKDAIALFCYEIKKRIGAYTAALGGVDIITFSGGIGERAPKIRERILSGLSLLGIEVDTHANDQGKEIISPPGSRVTIRILPANEEREIAHITQQVTA